ncbi:MAG: OprD family outer membrane porin [Pseudomonadales bacterium]
MLKRMFVPSVTALALMPLLSATSLPVYADGLSELLPSDGFYADVRIRHENVDQDGKSKEANANTIRTKFGYKSGVSNGFQFLIEGEDVASIGSTKFNDTLNGKTMYPVVADPVGTELNQAWLAYSGFSDTVIKAGRQGINLDNQRFVGTVGWRQNDQTFDAVQITNSSIDNLKLTFIEIDQVNRIFGEDSNVIDHKFDGKRDTTTRVLNATYKVSDALSVTGYGLWMDNDDALIWSSKTYGIRLTGSTAINDSLKLVYEAEAAKQSDYKDNPNSYDASYYHIAPAIKGKNWTVGVGFESLEGNDGVNESFETPLATLHKFNGWADMFLNTPDGGLEDTYAKAIYAVSGQGSILDGTKIVVMYHEFDAENSSMNYGDELDIAISHPLNVGNIAFLKGASIALKYADYNADEFGSDTQKLWVTTQFTF